MRDLHLAKNLVLPLNAVMQRWGYFATSGAGKTYTMLKMGEEMVKAGVPIVFLDPSGVCWGLRASANGKGPGLPVFILGGEHKDIPLEPTAGRTIANFVVEKRVPVILDLSGWYKAEQVRFAGDFFDETFVRQAKVRRPVHIYLDEADQFAPLKPMEKGQERMIGAALRMGKMGRARGLGWSIATQRPSSVHIDLRNICSVLVAGRTTKTVKVPALKDGQIARLERVAKTLLADHDVARGLAGKILDALKTVTAQPEAQRTPVYLGPPAPRVETIAHHSYITVTQSPHGAQSKTPRLRGRAAVLEALARLASLGVHDVPKQHVAALAGQSPRSSTFMEHLAVLRREGHIEYDAGRVRLTPQGRRQAPEHPVPASTDALIRGFLDHVLTTYQGDVFKALLDMYPKAIGKETLAERAGKSAASSTYMEALADMRALGLLEYKPGGEVRAHDNLFMLGGVR